MVDVRNTLAAVLAIGIGLGAVVAPAAVVRLQFVLYGADTGRHGEYGEDRTVGDRARWVVRIIGVAVLGVGVYLGAQPLL
ncbi:hypothetical protein SAMN06269185_0452 [Natronoarchaeum philippinense]|uniref:Uncharacterized protein n=1 Tax=Natronoarchaeum philippinense TaxID=558529 RepID=A0A285N3S6_NATPI|nr:hypothetical protein [Natronoarchaeum philippinense]SNZ04112.1 hypothetical protein SAMN06269185_0452 [Natronoarchaeum philippinense]